MIIANTLFFLTVNIFLFYKASSGKRANLQYTIIAIFILIILLLKFLYDYIYIEGLFLPKKVFMILSIFSFCPLIINLIRQRNIVRLNRRLDKNLKADLPKINYLLVLYILISITQIVILWSNNNLMNNI